MARAMKAPSGDSEISALGDCARPTRPGEGGRTGDAAVPEADDHPPPASQTASAVSWPSDASSGSSAGCRLRGSAASIVARAACTAALRSGLQPATSTASRSWVRLSRGVEAAGGGPASVVAAPPPPGPCRSHRCGRPSRTVDSRWAMTRVVRPAISRASAVLHLGLALGVERAGGLVEQQDRARPSGRRGRWRCAGAGRPTAARRPRRPRCRSPAAGPG